MNKLSSKPRRIQRKRTKGWKMPKNTVYVGRPTKWGNPFRVLKPSEPKCGALGMMYGVADTPKHAVIFYRQYLLARADAHAAHPKDYMPLSYIKETLRGKNLACFCPLDQPCHADVLLEIANV